jgi:hypothetical protein
VLIVLYPYLPAVPMPIYLPPGNWLGF